MKILGGRLVFLYREQPVMATDQPAPEPEQIVPPTPPPKPILFFLAIGVVLLLVAVVFLLRAMNRPENPSNADQAVMPVLGDPKAPLTIFEFGSFSCERCAKIRPVVKEVLSRYEGKVKLVYVSYPQGLPTAMGAAMAGVCAAEQGKFWEFADLMFDRQSSWAKDPNPTPLWMLYASQVGIDTNVMATCMTSPKTEKAVSQQLMMAAGAVIQATPTFVIGGSRLPTPRSADDFVKIIDKELAALHVSVAK